MTEQPTSVRADDPEARWLAETYRPGATQLTVRAVIAGMLLGGVMCVSNLYVFFKTGWSMGVTITAAILAYALFRGLSALGLAKRPLGLLPEKGRVGHLGPWGQISDSRMLLDAWRRVLDKEEPDYAS